MPASTAATVVTLQDLKRSKEEENQGNGNEQHYCPRKTQLEPLPVHFFDSLMSLRQHPNPTNRVAGGGSSSAEQQPQQQHVTASVAQAVAHRNINNNTGSPQFSQPQQKAQQRGRTIVGEGTYRNDPYLQSSRGPPQPRVPDFSSEATVSVRVGVAVTNPTGPQGRQYPSSDYPPQQQQHSSSGGYEYYNYEGGVADYYGPNKPPHQRRYSGQSDTYGHTPTANSPVSSTAPAYNMAYYSRDYGYPSGAQYEGGEHDDDGCFGGDEGSCVREANACVPSSQYDTFSLHRKGGGMITEGISGCLVGHVDPRYLDRNDEEEEQREANGGHVMGDERDLDDCQATAGMCLRGPGLGACVAGAMPPPPTFNQFQQLQEDDASSARSNHHEFDQSIYIGQENPLLAEVLHNELNGFCHYISFPKGEELTAIMSKVAPAAPQPGQPPSTPNIPIFFGQVLFSATKEQLTWMIYELAHVVPTIVTNHSPGCWTGYFKSDSDCAAVLELHKRILFDQAGVWLAKSTDQTQLLYFAALSQQNKVPTLNLPPNLQVSAKLPRGPLVVEIPVHKGHYTGGGGGGRRGGKSKGSRGPPKPPAKSSRAMA